MKQLSCGIVFLDKEGRILLAHATGQRHWDLPKGLANEEEQPLDAAIRETFEETGIEVTPADLRDLGRRPYNSKKDLHLFLYEGTAEIDPSKLSCSALFRVGLTGQLIPEVDAYAWFTEIEMLSRVAKNLKAVLLAVFGELAAHKVSA